MILQPPGKRKTWRSQNHKTSEREWERDRERGRKTLYFRDHFWNEMGMGAGMGMGMVQLVSSG